MQRFRTVSREAMMSSWSERTNSHTVLVLADSKRVSARRIGHSTIAHCGVMKPELFDYSTSQDCPVAAKQGTCFGHSSGLEGPGGLLHMKVPKLHSRNAEGSKKRAVLTSLGYIQNFQFHTFVLSPLSN